MEAAFGQPFGVASVTIPVAGGASSSHFEIRGREQPALYPAFSSGEAGRVLGQIFGGNLVGNLGDRAGSLTVLFLFQGDQPFQATVYTPEAYPLTVAPEANARLHDRLLRRWWRAYHADVKAQQDQGDYPPVVETYLTETLARRMGLEPPLLVRLTDNTRPTTPEETLQLMLGAEGIRLDTMRRTLRGESNLGEVADIPLPAPLQFADPQLPPLNEPVAVEPLANHVPQECFYVRFNTFRDYLWMNRLTEEYGGDLGRMITLRGFDAHLSEKLQQQIALRQNELAEIVGPAVIDDVAMIGRDLYLREGAAFGVLFHAKNSDLLTADFNNQRREALKKFESVGAKLETVKIGGRDATFLSTPDNVLRSYYVREGDYHLVTTSHAIAERFLEAGAGQGSLGQSAEFQAARATHPLMRQDSIFAYFSSSFFGGLASPRYQIELNRRMQAVTDIELMQMARLAAANEGLPQASVEDLVRNNLLPPGFGRRAEGSQPVEVAGEIVDSLRGNRGYFTPIPDVPLERVTRTEADRLAELNEFHTNHWKEMDPLIVAIRRFEHPTLPNTERVVIEANVSPFVRQKYGFITSMLGHPTTQRVSPAPGDIVSIQANVKGGGLFPDVPPHLLFLGVQDNIPVTDLRPEGLLKTLQIIRTTPGYLGSWPAAGYLDQLPFGIGNAPVDQWGFSQLLFGIWRRQWDGFSAISLDRRLLANVTPQLYIEEVDTEAQGRLFVGDLKNAQISALVNNLSYSRAMQASLGNARFLHLLQQQLGVPKEESLAVAEELIDADLVCSLEGEYVLQQERGRPSAWVSTAWLEDPFAGRFGMPATYEAPVLNWFRGAEAEMVMYEDRVVVRGVVDIERAPVEQKALPALPLFNLPNLFGRPTDANKPKPEVEELPKPAGESGPRRF